MSGGINRFDREATPTQAVDALDVVNDDGDLRRRPAFTSIATAPIHRLPEGLCRMVVADYDDSSMVSHADRDATLSSASIKRVYFGCDEVFDGIEAGLISSSGSWTKAIHTRVYYWDGSAWTELAWHRDTTRARDSSPGDRFQPMSRDGHLSWHRKKEMGDWAATTVDSVSKFWVRIDFWNTANDEPVSLGGTVTVAAPGFRAFLLQPVNGLIGTRLKSQPVIVAGGDALVRRGQERGAQLGGLTQNGKHVEPLRLVADEGAGSWDVITNTAWNGAGSWTVGVASRLQKNDRLYDWFFDDGGTEPVRGQFLGAPIQVSLIPAGGATTTAVTFTGLAAVGDEYEHCLLRCTTSAGGGPALGETRRIYACSTDIVYVYDAFSAAPVAGDRFAIIRPNADCIIDGEIYSVHQHDATSGAHQLQLVDSRPFAREPPGAGEHVFFELGHELRWSQPGGQRWSMAVDSVTGKVIACNGETPLLGYDGRRLRQLAATTSGDRADFYAGTLPDTQPVKGDDDGLAASKLLATPPAGRFVVDYMGRLVVSGIRGHPHDVAWSGPLAFNDLWPRLYRRQVRGPDHNPITGMAVLYDRLVVFTASSIHEAGPPDDLGQFFFRTAAQGIGFTSHHAVCTVALAGTSAIIGPSADGVRIFNGTEPVEVLDRWDRLIEGGVEVRRLDDAVAAVSRADTCYYLAVSSRGSDVNDRILRWDWSRKSWWVWSAPFGVSSMTTVVDPNGHESVLFGTSDGHIQVLTNAATDDGQTISARAKSPPLALPEGRDGSYVGTMLTFQDLGDQTVGLKTFTDRKQAARLDKTLSADADQSVYGTDAWDTAAWGDDRHITVRANNPAGSRGSQIQYEVSGSSRWRLRAAHGMVRPMGMRGR